MRHYLQKLWKSSRQAMLRGADGSLPEASTRRQITELVDTLGYDFTQYTLPGLIDFLNAYLPRPIQLVHFPTTFPQAIGLWYHTPHKEFVVIPTGAQFHPLLQEHIALHEIAHILLGHPPLPIADVNILAGFQEASSEAQPIGRALHLKPNYLLQPSEREAEYLATLIQQRALQAQRHGSMRTRGSSIAGLSPLARDLAFDENTA